MRSINLRVNIPATTPISAPVVTRLELGRQILDSIVVDGNSAKVDLAGFKITNRSQPVFPDAGKAVTVAEDGYHGFPSSPMAYPVDKKLSGVPADIELSFYNTDSAAVVVMITLYVDDPAPAAQLNNQDV